MTTTTQFYPLVGALLMTVVLGGCPFSAQLAFLLGGKRKEAAGGD
jgi:hypothetical protein